MRLRLGSLGNITSYASRVGAAILLFFAYCEVRASAQAVAQSNLASGTESPGAWLTKLSDAFVKDIEAGDVETAALHHIQLQAAVLMAIDPQGQESSLSQKLRNQLIQMAAAKSTGLIANNTAVTAPLLDGALLIQSAVANQDWKSAKLVIGNLSLPIAQTVSTKMSESQAKSITTISAVRTSGTSEPDPHFMVGLLRRVQDSLRADDVLTAESYAPQLLQLTQQWCDPSSQAMCYSEGVTAAYDALGRGAFLRGDYDGAKEYLLRSVMLPPGSVLIGGPSLKLAEALFTKGYTSEVTKFLEQSKSVWNSPLPEKWIKVIREGGHPNFKPVTYF